MKPTAQKQAPTPELGDLVRFKVPSLHGMSTITGTVKRITATGHIEVKSQGHGYFIISPQEVI